MSVCVGEEQLQLIRYQLCITIVVYRLRTDTRSRIIRFDKQMLYNDIYNNGQGRRMDNGREFF